MRLALCAALAIGAAGAGCLLTTQLDGFSDGDATPVVPDAAGLAQDGGVDSAASDGAPDASIDARAAAAAFRCVALSPPPAFCADFDEGTVTSNIGNPVTALGGQISLDNTAHVSPPQSLKLTTPAFNSGTARARVSRSFGFPPLTAVSIDFEMRLDSLDRTSSNGVSFSMSGYDLSLFLGATSKLREGIPGDAGGTIYTETPRIAPKAGDWVHVSFAVKLADGASTAIVAYDGVPQSAIPLVVERYRSAGWTVDVGFNFVGGPDDGRQMHIDNLVIDAK